jgi:YD repeat-containing protein
LRSIQTTGPAGDLQDLSYAYDPAGNLTDVWDLANQLTWSYEYDPLDRLGRAERSVGGLPQVYGYGYDPLNNLVAKSDPNADLNLTYPDPGQPRPHAPLQVWDGPSLLAEFTYNANGNRATRLESTGSVTYTYDIENRLTQVVSDTGGSLLTITFVYDGDGARVKRETSGGDATVYVGSHYTVASTSEVEKINTSDGTVEASEFYFERMLSLAVAEDGDTYTVWGDYFDDPALRGIYLRRYDAARGAWDPVVKVSDSTSNIEPFYPKVAVDPNENIYVLWQAGDEFLRENDIYFRRYNVATATWSAVEQVNDEQGSDSQVAGEFTGLAVDTAGNVYASWTLLGRYSSASYVLFDWRPAGGSWGTDIQVSDTIAYSIEDLSLSTNGQRLGIIWTRISGDEETILYDQMTLPSGTWGADQEVYYTAEGVNPHAPDMDIDSSNNVHVAWTTEWPFKVQYRRYDAASGQWQPPKDLVTLSGADDEVTWHSSLDANSQGDVVVAWQRGYGPWFDHCDSLPRVYFLERSAGSSEWTTSQAVDPSAMNGQQLSPEVDIDSSGTIRMIWADARFQCAQGKTTGYDLYGSISSSQGTKHYYANGQPLATRVDGVLYYVLGDAAGQSALFADSTGQEVGHIWYDPLGGVIQNTLPATLTEKLAGHLDTATACSTMEDATTTRGWGASSSPTPSAGCRKRHQARTGWHLA